MTAASQTSSAGPLSGVRVVGLEHSVAGPLCTRILADLGADVIKIERPVTGDFARHWDHHVNGESAQFWWLNRGKRAIALNLRDPASAKLFHSLLASADVLVQNLAPAAIERLGITADAISRRYPSLVNCQLSGYGATTSFRDRKAYDMLIQAESGILSLTGTPDQPTRVGVSLCDVATGLYAAIAVLAAVFERRDTGRGRYLDIPMFDVTLEFLGPMLLSFLNSGVEYARIPDRHHAIAPYGIFTCSTGESIVLAIEQDGEWSRFCTQIVGDAALATNPRYATNIDRLRNRHEVDAIVATVFRNVTLIDAVRLLESASFAFAQLNDVRAVITHAVTSERRVFTGAITADGAQTQAFVGLCERLFPTSRETRARPPTLDEDRDVLLAELKET